MKTIIESYDEEGCEDYYSGFPSRAGEELSKALAKFCKENKINLCNDEVLVIVEILRK
jgi:hypothetical protein